MMDALDLRELAEKLKTADNEKTQIAILQEMEKILLTKYVIRIGEHIIEPLWVEAYYYSRGKFEDENPHRDILQFNRFGKLYIKSGAYGGADICLSTGDYCLSFRMKAFLADNVYKTDTGIFDLYSTKEEQCKAEQITLQWIPKERPYKIIYTNRVNIKKESYKDAFLGAYSSDYLKNCHSSFPESYKKQWQRSIFALLQVDCIEKAQGIAKELNGAEIDKKYWTWAVEDWKESKQYDLCCIPFIKERKFD